MQRPLHPGRQRVSIVITALVLLTSVALLIPPASVTHAQTQLDSFNPNVNGPVYALALQADGKLLIGGNFTTISGQPRSYLARLNRGGTLDAAFAPVLTGPVYALALQPDGQIIVGGDFFIRDAAGRRFGSLVRFRPDGSQDISFRQVANDAVTDLVLEPDAQIVVAGEFTTWAPEYTRNRIARIDPSSMVDEAFDPDANGEVKALALQADGKLLVGGWFDTIGGQRRGSLVRLNADGSLDLTFDAKVNDSINAVALQADDKIVVGGRFSSIGGQRRDYLARLNADGTLDTTFTATIRGIADVLAVQTNGQIIVGGAEFTTVDGQLRFLLARLQADGSLDPAFDPNANGAVNALLIQPDGKLLVGGEFTQIGGQPRNYLARLINTAPVQQDLRVSQDGTTITWTRSGVGPELARVVFEQVSDNTNAAAPQASATLLGEGVRSANGWQLSGLTLPRNQTFVIRARGFYASGSIIEAEQRVSTGARVYLPLVRR
ncbi:MAG: delta-60 repeat domain-containing protein [Chloroflexaceae bacterium]|jgi:uncharacterized delta-60 repeat protein|nr:delta-60 repeat domain-containing protein [Chloroflexaceae bacterium]